MLVDRSGTEVAGVEEPTPFGAGRDGRVEADAGDLLAAVARALERLGPDRRRVEGAGVAGLAESGAPLDRLDRPLAPVIAWVDPRGAEVVALLEDRFGDGLALRIGQRLRTVSSVAKLGWLAGHGLTDVRWWLGVPELVVHALTGSKGTDFSLAARTGAYDVRDRRPLPEVLDALGVPRDVFPPPAPAGSVTGWVSAGGARWSGLRQGTPVTVAGHDHLAGLAGCGAADGDLVNSVGTAETVLGSCGAPPDVGRALDRRLAVTLRPDGQGWVVLGSAARAGVVIGAAAEALGRPPAELDALAEAAPGAVDAATFVATVASGGREAVDADGARALATSGPPGEVWNGVLEALAARTWEAADRVWELCAPPGGLVVFGGGSRSRPWLRAKARGGPLPVVRSSAGEAVARGAAVHAGVAAGWWHSAAGAPAPALVPVPPGGDDDS